VVVFRPHPEALAKPSPSPEHCKDAARRERNIMNDDALIFGDLEEAKANRSEIIDDVDLRTGVGVHKVLPYWRSVSIRHLEFEARR
jgi:hypothetical protein